LPLIWKHHTKLCNRLSSSSFPSFVLLSPILKVAVC
jgi:hypothetical protein